MKNDLYVYIEEQAALICYSFLLGILLALIYDAVRLLRTFLGCGLHYSENWNGIKLPIIGAVNERLRRKKSEWMATLTVFAFDILYMITASLTVILFLYAMYDGIVRSFSLISMTAAFVIYLITIGKITKKAAGAILFVLRVAIRYIKYFTLTPIVFISKRLAKAICHLYKITVGKTVSEIIKTRSSKLLDRYIIEASEQMKKEIDLAIERKEA